MSASPELPSIELPGAVTPSKPSPVTPDASIGGLTSARAAELLAEVGPNAIVEEVEHPCRAFSRYFIGPIPFMIEVALILAAALQDWVDVGIIVVLLVANAILGWNEERQAGSAIEALKQQLQVSVRARRDGKLVSVPVEQLVPGDVVSLKAGDAVPADGTILRAHGKGVEVDQSSLTGESLPVKRAAGDDLLSGSIIKEGECVMAVKLTGGNTEVGKIAHLVQSSDSSGHFQQVMGKIGKFLILADLVLTVIILVVGLIHGEDFLEVLQFCLVLSIAAVPIAMPAVLSVCLAIGSRQLAANGAVVTRLTAIEELAGVEILCSDKTGTLTKNELTLDHMVPVGDFSEADVLNYAAFASNREGAEVIDKAVLEALRARDADDNDELALFAVDEFVPFNPNDKRSEATGLYRRTGKRLVVTKGAVQAVLALATPEDEPQVARCVEATEDFAQRGLRGLAVACRMELDQGNDFGPWRMVGVLSIWDPPRDDTADTIANLHNHGLDVKMITGDQVLIGRETARRLGLGDNFMSRADLHAARGQYNMGDLVEAADGFGEVFPDDKHFIVQTLQRAGHLVAMTGDGVNDAAALRQANVGFAVHGATDAARGAASVVLTDVGLSTIAEAVIISRQVFARMTSYAYYRIVTTLQILSVMTFAILVWDIYLAPVLIVLISIMNDTSIVAIAYDDHAKPSTHPSKWSFVRLFGTSSVLGALMAISNILLLYYVHNEDRYSDDEIETALYLSISVGGHLVIFATRVEHGSFVQSSPSHIVTASVVVTQVIASIFAAEGVLMTAIGWTDVGYVWVYSIVWFLILDVAKQLVLDILSDDADHSDHPVVGATRSQVRISAVLRHATHTAQLPAFAPRRKMSRAQSF